MSVSDETLLTVTGSPVGTMKRSGLSQNGIPFKLIGRTPVSSSFDRTKTWLVVEMHDGGEHGLEARYWVVTRFVSAAASAVELPTRQRLFHSAVGLASVTVVS